jgi:hypothetical protein
MSAWKFQWLGLGRAAWAAVAPCLLICLLAVAGPGMAQDRPAEPGSPASPQAGQANPASPGPQKGPAARQPDKPAETKRFPVLVEHKGTDDLGSRFVYNLKEKFNSSSFFRLSAQKERKLRIRIVTSEEFKERPYLGSMYTVIWLFAESGDVLSYYLDSDIGFIGPQGMPADEAEKIVARTQPLASQYSYLFE